MNNFIVFLLFLIAMIPGIYLATKNNFVIIKNRKYNSFIIRAIYLLPLTTILVLLPVSIIIYIFSNLEIGHTIMDTFGEPIILAVPAIFGLLFIFIVHKYFLRKDMPPEYWPDFEKYELYVYMPEINIQGGGTFGTKFTKPINQKGLKELQRQKQLNELIIDFKSMKDKDIACTYYGEIVVSEKALELFKEKSLTGFQEQTVKNSKDSRFKTEIKYYQLIPTHIMPPMSTETKIIRYIRPSVKIYIADNLVYYDESVLPTQDFNISLELFGENNKPFNAPRYLWIVTNRTMKILVNDLEQHKRDFIPITLVDVK
ncbi:hypothetical protein MmiHf6_13970 [Methanimicrococcus hongohii]|uniref:Uncharacterized protein n=1 Tax=Methanimicrococcus hongohii TaxID=3028295 RepID=A0AA96V0E6_9EURY|nr:hypothetical protein [Methanimicrococcus sp. Hf6]WNY24072.1 hypothetical protein MmiHf6_13970 [Methanimicrococcus sp. Hf6]